MRSDVVSVALRTTQNVFQVDVLTDPIVKQDRFHAPLCAMISDQFP
jgi:hypothetical protein